MKRTRSTYLALIAVLLAPMAANADLISVSGPLSNLGDAAAIIGAPSDALDDLVTNTAMQGFNEAQGVITTVAHAIDGGGSIAAGTLVDSHMIFLNSEGTALLSQFSVEWVFDGIIIGIMSDSGGFLEAASTFELGNPGTNYTVTGSGTGPAAPFPARGMEVNVGGSGTNDGYTILDPYTLQVGMWVTEPGDWIRVITATPVPEPGTLGLLGIGLAAMGLARRRRKI